VTWATSWHKLWGQWLVVFLVVLHLGALIWYRFRQREFLVSAMLHGQKTLPVAVPESLDRFVHRLLALVLLVMSSVGVWFLVSQGT
jgi:cytochrome b561